jgi:hypothetical protein
VIHGLGFSGTQFNYARDGLGERKNIVEMKAVTDNDGSTDDVWHFVKGRAYEMAAAYFACNSEVGVTWDGLPMMGLPESGRGSHWETRIMRDDVMSYGGYDRISPITLAAMEDLGW